MTAHLWTGSHTAVVGSERGVVKPPVEFANTPTQQIACLCNAKAQGARRPPTVCSRGGIYRISHPNRYAPCRARLSSDMGSLACCSARLGYHGCINQSVLETTSNQ